MGSEGVTATDVAAEVRKVFRTFEAELAPIRALRGVDLVVRVGEFVAIMGPSGCGKSTLLTTMAGIDVPDEGQVFIAGREISRLDANERARMRRNDIGIVFQFFNLLEAMSVQENVVLPGLVAGVKRKAAQARARDLLDLLGLADKANALPATLSGGQRQRLAIARALVNRPALLLADEPTGALDSDGGAEILEIFRRINRDTDQTIVMVTHDQPVADAAQRIVRMRDGRVTDTAQHADGADNTRSTRSQPP